MSKQFEHFDGWGHGALCLYVDKIESLAREAGAALQAIKQHHTKLNANVGRPTKNSHTIALADAALTKLDAALTKLDAAGLLPGKEGE